MEFTGEIAEIQQQLARCSDIAARRLAVAQTLAPRRGERLLEIGCGAGLLLRELALAVGPHGLAAGLDISPDQIGAAEAECTGIPAAKPEIGDVRALGYGDAVFDAAVAVQAVEYVPEVETALAEIRRVLKAGGRFHCLATNWTSSFWHGPEIGLTARIASAWENHAAHPNLPARLAPMLARAGFTGIRQLPVPIVNADFGPAAFAYWLARLMAAHAAREGTAPGTAEAWLAALAAADAEGEFFFSSVPILTTAIAA
ncbi:hypothetical protein LNKW23_11660 [Paralimibaculum aggregatum]|uniref:Methyltransferase type 11 domain-containing protein n=1 Tax=Paralimibaculum aggregatum TaxID=3036245 RepID=A0ABQ6LM94_9RHOB|nr:methyltransferase domain-containing protein [Limibaculum sp. NKW23]GMG81953.1 hypothetical protein LNKW23_11660 [Limibaculum sp. NKW23]